MDDMEASPKTINAIYGYRTRMSSLNQNTWHFSQEYAGQLWVRWGIRMMAVSILLLMIFAASGETAAWPETKQVIKQVLSKPIAWTL